MLLPSFWSQYVSFYVTQMYLNFLHLSIKYLKTQPIAAYNLAILICRKSHGDYTIVGKPQQLYKPVDIHGVQRPPTSPPGALLSLQTAGAFSGGQVAVDVVHIEWTFASVRVTTKTICTVTTDGPNCTFRCVVLWVCCCSVDVPWIHCMTVINHSDTASTTLYSNRRSVNAWRSKSTRNQCRITH